ncbi:MAG: hypothetical protein ABFC56_06425, partial [Clostridiaceae bacterium]
EKGMSFRVVSPRITWIIYLGIEMFAIPFFLLLLFDIGPYQVYDSMPGARLIQLLFLCFALLLPLYFEFFNFGSLRLQMDETGVTYKSRQVEYHLSWNEVKRISLNPDAPEQLSTSKYVCFFAEEEPRTIIARSGFNSRAFGLQYRKGLPAIIKKYCDLPIERLDTIERKKK